MNVNRFRLKYIFCKQNDIDKYIVKLKIERLYVCLFL
jgi:hypothetical protein